MANQFSNRPPFCDFLERFQAVYKSKWKTSQLRTQRVGLGRFDQWLKVCPYSLQELNWKNLFEFHRFLEIQGASPKASLRALQVAKFSLRWGIETGELPQKLQDIYTSSYSQNKWTQDLPEISQEYLAEMEPSRPGSYRAHKFSHRIFHQYLAEKKISYRKFKLKHAIAFVKYLNDKKLQQRTRGHTAQHIRIYLCWLYQKRKISRHPDDTFPRHIIPKRVQSLPRPLDPEIDMQLQQLLEESSDLIFKAILLLRRTGLRITELRKLEFNCIQTDHNGRSSLIVPPVKLGTERRVPLDPDTIKLIELIQGMSLRNYKLKTTPKYLVIGPNGTSPRYELYNCAMTAVCAKLKLQKWINLHSLRHTYATSLLNAGLPITSLKEILGHKTIIMSLMYAKVAQVKIKAEFSQALTLMNEKHVPKIFEYKSDRLETAFIDLNNIADKVLDTCSDPQKAKQLKNIKNRLIKLKMEFLKLTDNSSGE